MTLMLGRFGNMNTDINKIDELIDFYQNIYKKEIKNRNKTTIYKGIVIGLQLAKKALEDK